MPSTPPTNRGMNVAQAFETAAAFDRQGRTREAERVFRAILQLEPHHFGALHRLGKIAVRQKRPRDAERLLLRALAVDPNSAEAHSDLGMALMACKRHDDAMAHFVEALRLEPDLPEAHNNLGNALARLSRHDEAVPHYLKAIEVRPAFFEAHNNLGDAFAKLHRHEEAVACFHAALAIRPNLAEAHAGLGNELRTLGRLEESRLALAKAVELAPRRGDFHSSLAESRRYTAGDPHLAAMAALAAGKEKLPDRDRLNLHFGLGKAYADIGEHEKAFRHLRDGNALKRSQTPYDESAALSMMARVRRVFTSGLIAQKAALGDPSSVPVFVVGMPRSGTTLVEQLLASHPKIAAAGERPYLIDALNRLQWSDRSGIPFPELTPSMGGKELREIAAGYLAALEPATPPVERITDKMPENFILAGLIHLVLPNARIVHARRNPLDTCFSCFSKLFAGGFDFVYDLAELGRYYRAYEALMDHWRRVLPPGVMLDVQYEELVADFGTQARRIVAFCGVEWDDRCLAFHETQRPVTTASAVQVRQPIYASSIGRWRPYAPMLRPLFEALELDPVP